MLGLEEMLAELRVRYDDLMQEYNTLMVEYSTMKEEFSRNQDEYTKPETVCMWRSEVAARVRIID